MFNKIVFSIVLLFFLGCSNEPVIQRKQRIVSNPFLASAKRVNRAYLSRILKTPYKKLSTYGFISGSKLVDRVKKTPPIVLRKVGGWDGEVYTNYQLTAKERQLFKRSFAQLPLWMRRVLKKRLVGFYFISENFKGSGMTDWIPGPDGKFYAYILINKKLLNMNMSEWLSWKERTAYKKRFWWKKIKTEIKINGGRSYSPLLAILLHEGAHVYDYVKGATPFVGPFLGVLRWKKGLGKKLTPFIRGYWANFKQPVVSAFKFHGRVCFYGLGKGPQMYFTHAYLVYNQLVHSPYISLYGSMSWAEDFAEMVCFYHLTQKLKQPYTISIWQNGKLQKTYAPIKNLRVRNRFPVIEKLYKDG